jgi:hypothetical protein
MGIPAPDHLETRGIPAFLPRSPWLELQLRNEIRGLSAICRDVNLLCETVDYTQQKFREIMIMSRVACAGRVTGVVGSKRVLSIILCLILMPPVFAHHGNVIFDRDSVVTIQGTVSRYLWRNPHVYVYVETLDEAGKPVEWQLEGDPTPIMSRSGWTSNILAPGDPVTVRLNPDRREGWKQHGLLVSLEKADGLVLTPRSGGRASTVSASSLEGTWDGLRDNKTRRFIYGKLTEKGAAAQAAYTEADNPVSECIPFPLPTMVAAPYLYQIEILDDRIFVSSELFNVVRTFYTDGRGHAENGERTNQGHSIAWWEDDVLVVDTTLYEDNIAGNRNGVPSGAQKHSVERYEMTEDGTRLKVDYVIEDPEYMAEPLTGGIVWDYAPDREMMPFECNLENARLYE